MSVTTNALLTGATGGIGQAMAHNLAAMSHQLVLQGRNDSALQALAQGLRDKFPSCSVSTVVGDLTDGACQDELAAAARANEVNLVIQNAGINQFSLATNLEPTKTSQIMQVNLMAPMQLAAKLFPVLSAQANAQMIFVGSIFGYIGYPGNSAYCASKFGLRGFAQALRREWANSGVAVKYFAPRATKTAINEGAVDALNQALKVASDSPALVANRLVTFIAQSGFEYRIGYPEKIFVLLNSLFPRINDFFIRKQLPTINKYL